MLIVSNIPRNLLHKFCTSVKSYFSLFSFFPQDLLDILVGWHIDITQPGRVIWFVSDALQRLARLWIADMGFTLSVMSQFLDDMQCYTEDLASIANCKENEKDSRETLQSAQEAVSKLTLFLK